MSGAWSSKNTLWSLARLFTETRLLRLITAAVLQDTGILYIMLPGASKLGRVNQTSLVPFVLLLLFSKTLRSLGIFLIYDLLKVVHLVIFVFIIKAGSAGLLVLTQKPFSSGKKISKHQWLRIARHAFGGTLVTLLWIFGLTLCGPLRGVLLFEHSDVVVGAFVAVVFTNRYTGPARTRAAVMFFFAILILLLFDIDSQPGQNEHSEGIHSSALTHLFYHAVSWSGVSDHKVVAWLGVSDQKGGVILLVLTLLLSVAFKNTSRKLSVDVGGSKRLHALSTLVSSLLLFPWAMIHLFIHEDAPASWWPLILPLASIVLIVFVLDYYVEFICTGRLESYRTARYATYAMILSALGLSLLWGIHQHVHSTEHALTGGVIFSAVLFLLATRTLGKPVERQGSAGSFVGYTTAGRPLYNITGDALQKTSHSIMTLARSILRQILEEYDSRQIFYFLCVNMGFTFVELIYGVWTNSLGLISDGFHMLFDCLALVVGLTAAVMSHWKATRIFSYGYGRVEVLSGFVNGLFLVVIGVVVFLAAVGRLVDPPEINTERLLTVSIGGLLVNLVGIVAFSNSQHHGHSHGLSSGHSHGSSSRHGHGHGEKGQGHSHGGKGHGHSHGGKGHGHSHGGGGHAHTSHGNDTGGTAKNRNMQGVYLHVLADTMGSVGVIISSLLIEQFGILIADPVCSVFISVMILLSVIPLLRDTAAILLQRTPPEVEQCLNEGFAMVRALDGIVSYRNPHFWTHAGSTIAGTLHIQLHRDANEQRLVQQVTSIFKELGITNFTVQAEKEAYFQHMTGLNESFEQTMFTPNPRNMIQQPSANGILDIKAV